MKSYIFSPVGNSNMYVKIVIRQIASLHISVKNISTEYYVCTTSSIWCIDEHTYEQLSLMVDDED